VIQEERMNRIILLVAALALVPVASAQLYKYVDKDGKVVYSDQPPANVDSKQLRIQSAPADAAAAPKSALAKDKDLDKERKAEDEKAKKNEQSAKSAADNEQRCVTARELYAQFDAGGRLTKRTASGERVFMEDAEIAAEKEKARAQMEQACKKT
jgi:hypothetical protein